MQMFDLSISRLSERYPELFNAQSDILNAIKLLFDCFNSNGKLLIAGNGGSSADAEHICGELVKGFLKTRKIEGAEAEALDRLQTGLSKKIQKGLPAFSLGVSHALMSAFANDLDPNYVYAQQVYVHGNQNDVFWGITTSGNSKNILNAFLVAKARGLKTILLTGDNGGVCSNYADIVIRAPRVLTHEVQELHLPIYHAICIELEHAMFKE